jgi:hypothetical protein
MKLIRFIIVSLLVCPLVPSAFAAEAPVIQSGTFYLDIYRAVSEGADDALLDQLSQSLDISSADTKMFVREQTLNSIAQVTQNSYDAKLYELTRDRDATVNRLTELLASRLSESQLTLLERHSGHCDEPSSDSLIALLDAGIDYDHIEAYCSLYFEMNRNLELEASDNSVDSFSDYLVRQEKFLDDLNFERGLVDLKQNLTDEVAAIELFADGQLNSLAENFPSYDLLRDLDVIDFLIFGVTESVNLSPNGNFVLPGFAGGGGGKPSESDVNSLSSLLSPAALYEPKGVDEFASFEASVPGLPFDLASPDRRLEDSNVVSILDQQAQAPAVNELSCAVPEGLTLDFSPARSLEAYEKQITDSYADFDAALTASVGGDDILNTLSESLSSQQSAVLGVSFRPDADFGQQLHANFDQNYCFAIDFDVRFCARLDIGNYNNPRTIKDENCIACHLSKINGIFTDDLLPYRLMAQKNEGLIGADGFCTDALVPNSGFYPVAVSKPAKNYYDICSTDILGPQRRQALLIHDTYDSRRKEFDRSIADIDARIHATRSALSGASDPNYTRQELALFNNQKRELVIKMDRATDNWLAAMTQWRAIQDRFQEQAQCQPTVGAQMADESFNDRLQTYANTLLANIPQTAENRTRESQVAEQILQQFDLSQEDIFARSGESGVMAENSYATHNALSGPQEEDQWMNQTTKHLEKEIREMTSHFQSILDALEALRRGGNQSTLKKILNKKSV